MNFKLSTLVLITSIASAVLAEDKGNTPANMVGEWRWGTINPIWFEDTYTGQYTGHGGGTSVQFDFDGKGNFKRYVYIETNNYGWRMQTMTMTEGKVVFDGDSFRCETKKGKYRVSDNRVKKNNYTRPMTDVERAKDSKTLYYWAWKDKQLNIGFSRESMSIYKPAK